VNSLLLGALAIAPGFVLLFLFYKLDKYEPEPPEKVRAVLLAGMLSPLVVVPIALALNFFCFKMVEKTSIAGVAVDAFLVAALVEESAKFAVVWFTIYHDPEFDEPYDGIVYCVTASLGFAIIENLFYLVGGELRNIVARALLSVPLHALAGVFMGTFMGLSKFRPTERRKLLMLALLVPVLAHGTYDFFAFMEIPQLSPVILPLLGVFWVVALTRVRVLVKASPFAPKESS
jgi:RsiW-degrading membrane proteinase PrsW (M82 family)